LRLSPGASNPASIPEEGRSLARTEAARRGPTPDAEIAARIPAIARRIRKVDAMGPAERIPLLSLLKDSLAELALQWAPESPKGSAASFRNYPLHSSLRIANAGALDEGWHSASDLNQLESLGAMMQASELAARPR
jgi:hypothetical protein